MCAPQEEMRTYAVYPLSSDLPENQHEAVKSCQAMLTAGGMFGDSTFSQGCLIPLPADGSPLHRGNAPGFSIMGRPCVDL